jgi:hypothetical protein
MNFVKYSLIAAGLISFTSCLKPKADFGGTRTDAGTIVTSITEAQYINTDLQNIGYTFTGTSANFSFATPNESVRFFTLHIAQPRDTKVSGSMTVRVAMSAADPSLFTPLPAGAVTVSDITVPASDAAGYDVPVMFTVNKALLDPTEFYGAVFTITSTSQGVFSELDKSVTVVINGADGTHNTDRVFGRYLATTTIIDSANLYRIHENKRPYILSQGIWNPFGGQFTSVPNRIYLQDLLWYGLTGASVANSLQAYNTVTGATTEIVRPIYVMDATGKVTDVLNRLTNTTLSPVFDNSVSNQFTYTSNTVRTLTVKYTVRLTVGAVTQPFTITDSYTYDPNQVTF